MTLRKKIYLLIFALCVTVAAIVLYIVVDNIASKPLVPPSVSEEQDTKISQYNERPNSNSTSTVASRTLPLPNNIPTLRPINKIISSITKVPIPEAGCNLNFAFTATQKTITPNSYVDYEGVITNKGADKCENVSISVYYKEGESYESSTPAPTASDYYWQVGDMKYGAVYNLKLKTHIQRETEDKLFAEACATADNSADVCSYSVIFMQNKNTNLALTQQKVVREDWGQTFGNREFGIWVWDTPLTMTPAYSQQVIQNAKQNGFNVIYLSIDDYLSVAATTDPTELARKKEEYMKALNSFIRSAKVQGISVDALGGAKDWGESRNRYLGFTLIDFAKSYNQKYPNDPIRRFQYDVEPYLLPQYAANKSSVLYNFIEFIDQSQTRLADSNIGFSVVIPHFYDADQAWTPAVNYNGQNVSTYTHILKILGRKSNSSVLIMSYRNFFSGEDGVEQITKAELEEAQNNGSNVKIIIAQETGNVEPSYVTYFGLSKGELADMLSVIQNNFSKYPNYSGLAVHYFDSFLKMQ
jgi:hypothetical protein